MITNVNERSNTLFIKNKYTDAIALQQLQNQSKTLRNLYSIYNDNINLLSKNYKICLGQIQTMPKIKVSREEIQHTLQHLKRIYPKFQNKLIRDSINRNSFIRKSYEDYINYYEKTNDAQMQQISQDERLKINQNSYTQSAKNMYGKGLVRPNISSLSNKRPLSSKNYNKTVNLNILNQAYQSFNNTGTYKMRTISGINYDNHYQNIRYTGYNATINPQKNQNIFSRPKKVFFYGQKRYEENIEENKKYQQFLFDGTQIIIRQRKNKQNNKQIISNNGFICINSLSSSNNKNKIITSSKYAQRKSIDQIQRMQIQNRILMVNSALSVGLTPSQGYRPKSRCWQNYFN